MARRVAQTQSLVLSQFRSQQSGVMVPAGQASSGGGDSLLALSSWAQQVHLSVCHHGPSFTWAPLCPLVKLTETPVLGFRTHHNPSGSP